MKLMPPGLTINATTLINYGKIAPEATFNGGGFTIGRHILDIYSATTAILQITNNTTTISRCIRRYPR